MGFETPPLALQSPAETQAPPPPAAAGTSLAPGFRFHPTDQELVSYYLKRKVCGKPIRFDAISETDIYKSEPWDLPDLSRLKSRDNEWYFFGVQDKKYVNGSRVNRATGKGYWKATGNDRPIIHSSRTVGMKKTLVFYSGRAPCGKRTNWVMHEYRLTDEEVAKEGIPLESYLLCKILKKSGPGFKPGEQYGPFVEEEWDQQDSILIPGEEAEEDTNGNVDPRFEDSVHYMNGCEGSLAIEAVRGLLPLSCKMENNGGSGPEPFPVTSNKRLRHEQQAASEISSSTGPAMAKFVELPLLEPKNGPVKLFEDLRNEIYKISIEKESLKIEVMSTRTMINILQSKVDHLTKENQDLKRMPHQPQG